MHDTNINTKALDEASNLRDEQQFEEEEEEIKMPWNNKPPSSAGDLECQEDPMHEAALV